MKLNLFEWRFILLSTLLLIPACTPLVLNFEPPEIDTISPALIEEVRGADSLALVGFTSSGDPLFPGLTDGRLKQGVHWNGDSFQLTYNGFALPDWGRLQIDSVSVSHSWEVQAGLLEIGFQKVPLFQGEVYIQTPFQRVGNNFLSVQLWKK
ncbi:MAG: hypothetical protein AAFR61_15295 [Bacteroidota bacterium]